MGSFKGRGIGRFELELLKSTLLILLLALVLGGCRGCRESVEEDEAEPVPEEITGAYGAAGRVVAIPAGIGEMPRIAADARVRLLLDVEGRGSFEDALEVTADLNQEGLFQAETEKLSFEGEAPKVSILVVAELEGHGTAYRRIEAQINTLPWVDIRVYEYQEMMVGHRASLPDETMSIVGMPDSISRAYARLFYPMLDAEGFSGDARTENGMGLAFGVVGAVELYDDEGNRVRSLDEAVTLRMELLEETWEMLAVVAPGRDIKPGDDFLDPSDDFLDPSDDFLDPSDDFLDPSDDFLDPSDDFLDPSDDFFEAVAAVPLFSFSESSGSWSIGAVGRLETLGGVGITYGGMQDVWSGDVDSQIVSPAVFPARSPT